MRRLNRIVVHASREMIFLTALVLLVAGCPKDPYRAAIQGSDDVSQAVHSAIKITGEYYSNGTFNDAQKATAAKYYLVVTDCNMSFRKAITGAHNSGQTGAQAFLPIADSFVVCVKNAAPVATDQKLSDVLKLIDVSINGISLAISNAKGK